jgi:hypothetical protein
MVHVSEGGRESCSIGALGRSVLVGMGGEV